MSPNLLYIYICIPTNRVEDLDPKPVLNGSVPYPDTQCQSSAKYLLIFMMNIESKKGDCNLFKSVPEAFFVRSRPSFFF